MSSEKAPEGKPEELPADSRAAMDAEPPRRRRSSLVVVSVAAAVLVAGGGGAYWASTSSHDVGSAGADGGPPPLQLDGYGQQESSDARDSGIAPGEPNPGGPAFRATGPLPEGPGSAKVYHPAAEVTRADVERLAEALDLAGKPELTGGSWKVGGKDASGPVLTVNSKTPGIWTYTRHAVGGCSEPSKSGPKGSEGDGAPSRCPAPGEIRSEPSDGSVKPVSEQEAERVATPVLEAAGVGDAEVDASRTAGAVRTVSADPKVDGLPTYGLTTGLQVGADGNVVSGNGRLGELRAGPEYPVNNAEETLKRLNESRGGGKVGIGGCASAMPDAAVASGKTPKADPCASEGKQNEREPAKVRKATFGLAAQFVEGKQALVPSWLFEVELPGATGPQATFTVTHPAVKPQYIARPDQGGEQRGGEQGTKPGAGMPDVTSYSAEGRELTVGFWGGVCDDYRITADESGDAVKVKVTGEPKKPGQNCIKVAKKLEEKVTLDKPLGDRKVVDARTGKGIGKR
ncbi:hypothetical protein [Streptomyces meridianus]|uniref:Large membrane protein n=1 Tax=Streptomyces meridianus TaxID=2938945 RepID=A0ABT0X1F7_9ACTN|nr:hypothetical protein [Streptomyces meridianus]MCM2576388.1 hypothetical protein [Streptomyces meridianus]